jgi:sulfur transfer complex TusBCD TusB component (DsrH family)
LAISVLVPVRDPPPDLIDALARSVLQQDHRSLQLVLADDGCEDPEVLARLRGLAETDERVVLVQAGGVGISAATNAAAAAAGGEVLAFADHDDLLARGVLGAVARAYEADPELELAYTDEDMLDGAGRRVAPSFRPGPSPWLSLGFNCACHLLTLRRSLFDRVGGLRSAFDGAQDHDLLLRALEQARRAAHLPGIGYHWRRLPGSVAFSSAAKPWAYEAGRRAILEACARRRLAVLGVDVTPVSGVHRLEPSPVHDDRPTVLVLHGPAASRVRWRRTLPATLAVDDVADGVWPAAPDARLLVVDARGRPDAAPLARVLAWCSQPGVRAVAGTAVSGGRRWDAGRALDREGRAQSMLPGTRADAAGPGLLGAALREVAAGGEHLLAVDGALLPDALVGRPVHPRDVLLLGPAAAARGSPLLHDPHARFAMGEGVGLHPQTVDLSAHSLWEPIASRLPDGFWTAAGHDRYCPRVSLLAPLGLPD